MSKYIKLEDMENLIINIAPDGDVFERGMLALQSIPTIDIVHCRDCKHRYVTGTTTQYYVCDFMDAQFDGNSYCHHGERIESEE